MTSKAQSNATMAFIAGLTAGSVLAMLFAPKSGEETRAELKEKVNHAKSKSNEVMETSRDKINKTLDSATGKVQTMAEKMQQKSGKTKDMAGKMRTDMKQDSADYTDTTRL